MDFQALIERRASVRQYTSAPVKEEDLRAMVAAAHEAPSASNKQSWHYVCIQNPVLKEKLAAVIAKKNAVITDHIAKSDAERAQKMNKFTERFTLFFRDAPVVVLVFSQAYAIRIQPDWENVGASEADLAALRATNPAMQSLGASIEHFLLKAEDLGYGACWLTSANYVAKEIEALLKNEGFEKEGFFFAALLSLGVAAEGARKPHARKPLEEVYTYFG